MCLWCSGSLWQFLTLVSFSVATTVRLHRHTNRWSQKNTNKTRKTQVWNASDRNDERAHTVLSVKPSSTSVKMEVKAFKRFTSLTPEFRHVFVLVFIFKARKSIWFFSSAHQRYLFWVLIPRRDEGESESFPENRGEVNGGNPLWI